MGKTGGPIAMIGLDAADLGFIRANISSLPNLRRALETGIMRELHSTAGALTGSVWPTFYAGKPPGDHGIYHHLQWDSSQMQLRRVTEDWLYCEPFWYELERRGLNVIAIDVPMTFRPRLTRGIEVITWGSHDELTPFATHPTELGRSIMKRFGSHPMGHEIPVRHSRGELEKIRRNLVKGAQLKAKLGEWLAAQPWDFFLIVFGECHRGGHILWPGNSEVPPGALLEVYQAVDQAVVRLLEVFGQRVASSICSHCMAWVRTRRRSTLLRVSWTWSIDALPRGKTGTRRGRDETAWCHGCASIFPQRSRMQSPGQCQCRCATPWSTAPLLMDTTGAALRDLPCWRMPTRTCASIWRAGNRPACWSRRALPKPAIAISCCVVFAASAWSPANLWSRRYCSPRPTFRALAHNTFPILS